MICFYNIGLRIVILVHSWKPWVKRIIFVKSGRWKWKTSERKEEHNNKINLVNATIKEKFCNVKTIHLCDHSNLYYRGSPQSKFLKNDGNVHLTDTASSILSCLGIPQFKSYKINEIPIKVKIEIQAVQNLTTTDDDSEDLGKNVVIS